MSDNVLFVVSATAVAIMIVAVIMLLKVLHVSQQSAERSNRRLQRMHRLVTRLGTVGQANTNTETPRLSLSFQPMIEHINRLLLDEEAILVMLAAYTLFQDEYLMQRWRQESHDDEEPAYLNNGGSYVTLEDEEEEVLKDNCREFQKAWMGWICTAGLRCPDREYRELFFEIIKPIDLEDKFRNFLKSQIMSVSQQD